MGDLLKSGRSPATASNCLIQYANWFATRN